MSPDQATSASSEPSPVGVKTVRLVAEERPSSTTPTIPTSDLVAEAYARVLEQEALVDECDIKADELRRKAEALEDEDVEIEKERGAVEKRRRELDTELARLRVDANRVGNVELSSHLKNQVDQCRSAFDNEMRNATAELHSPRRAAPRPKRGVLADTFYLATAGAPLIDSGGVTAVGPMPILSPRMTPRNYTPRGLSTPSVSPRLAPYSPRSVYSPRSQANLAAMPPLPSSSGLTATFSSTIYSAAGSQLLPPYSRGWSEDGHDGRRATTASRTGTMGAFGIGTMGSSAMHSLGLSSTRLSTGPMAAAMDGGGGSHSPLTANFGPGPLTRETFEAAQRQYALERAALPVPRHSQLSRVPKPSLLRRVPAIAATPGIPFEWHSGPLPKTGLFAVSPRLDASLGPPPHGREVMHNSLLYPQGPFDTVERSAERTAALQAGHSQGGAPAAPVLPAAAGGVRRQASGLR